MNKKSSTVISFITGILCGILIITQLSFSDNKDKVKSGSEGQTGSLYEWHPPALPAEMNFAGEKTPLHRWEVKESLDREILFNFYRPENILYMLKLANRYFPMIEQELKAQGVPDDFKYLCVAESNMTNAISRVGAVGFWQFMKYTSPGYNLEVNENIDERYHVKKSTIAACQYLKKAYEKFGSWTAAAASYNCGMGGYESQSNFQQSSNYYDLLLPEETQRYIFRILAYKHLMGNADELGFKASKEELYDPVATRSILVNKTISNLSTFARENGTTYKMLKWLNPWLRGRSLTVRAGKSYTILLPNQ